MATDDWIEKHDTKRGKNNRGSTNNVRRLRGLRAPGPANGGSLWSECTPDYLAAVVVSVTGLGGAVTFGLSRDGGASSVTILLEDERETLWFNGDAELEVELQKVLTFLETLK